MRAHILLNLKMINVIYHGGITWSYKELNSLVFNYAMYTAKSSILHTTWSYEERKSLPLHVI